MPDKDRAVTIETYNRSAPELAAYFRGIGSRVADIDRAVALVGLSEPHVVEIGCGDGRDAQEVLARTPNYRGMDISPRMIELARKLNPGATFEVADIAEYVFPEGTHLMFAFASLLHSDEQEVASLLRRAHEALVTAGIVYLSLKEGAYRKELKKDVYGTRAFYFYTPEIIRRLAGPRFSVAYEERQCKGETSWFTLALRKDA